MLDRRRFMSQVGACCTLLAAQPFEACAAAYGSSRLLRLPDNRPGAEVYVNGYGPFRFLIDTATSHSIVSPRIRDRLRLRATGRPPASIATGAGSVTSQFYALRETATAGVIVEGLEVLAIDLPGRFGIDGIVAADFLSNFSVDLNLPSRTVTLYPALAGPSPTEPLDQVQGTVNDHGFIVVPVRVERVPAFAVLDTGARQTVVNSRLAQDLHRGGTMMVEEAFQNYVFDAANQRYNAETRDFEKIQLGRIIWQGTRAMVADLNVFTRIGLGDERVVFVGMDLIAPRRIVLDYAAAKLRVSL